MRIIFAGTPEFAVPCLQRLLESYHEVIAVYTQPDRPSGRGQRLRASAVKQLAQQYALTLCQPITLRDPTVQREIRAFRPELMVVVAYGLMIPREVLGIPKLGCINVHASLLPRWRGAAPIQRAILAGDTETGVSLMQMEAGLDTGAILSQTPCSILEQDTTTTLQARLASLGADCLVSGLGQLERLQATARLQDDRASCYAKKICKSEGLLNWDLSATQLLRQIRAFNSWPVAFTFIGVRRVRIWQAMLWEGSDTPNTNTPPGTIVRLVPSGAVVSTGKGYLCITHIQLEGGKCISVSAALNMSPPLIAPGMQLGVIVDRF